MVANSVRTILFGVVLALGAGTAQAACVSNTPALAAAIEPIVASVRPGLSLAVVHRGEVVLSCSQGADLESSTPVTRDTAFRIASVTKPFTAALILKLIEEGRMALDDRLSRWIPELPAAERVTIRQLLTHTAGLPDYSEHPGYRARKARRHAPAELIAWFSEIGTDGGAPGTRWAYSNQGYQLLGIAATRATGDPLERLYASRLFEPAGRPDVRFDDGSGRLASTPGYTRDRSAASGFVLAEAIDMTVPGAAGALVGSAEGVAVALDAMLTDRVLTSPSRAAWVEPGTLRDGRTTRWGMPPAWREGLQADYGLGWFIDERNGRRRLWHGGDIDGFTSRAAHFPADGITVVTLSNGEHADLKAEAVEAAVLDALP